MKFSQQVAKFVRDTKKALDKTVSEVVLETHNHVIAYTPVDTGELRNSWQVSSVEVEWGDTAAIYTNKEYAPVVEYGLYPGVGLKTVQLNDGIYSKQAPKGMVRITTKEMKGRAQEIWHKHAP